MGDPAPFQLPAQTIYPPLATPVAVVSPQFIAPYPVDLRITKKSMTIGSYTVTDVNGSVMFKIEGSVFSVHDRRVLFDGAGNPVITFQHKLCSLHKKWLAYRGESRDSKDLMFTVLKPSVLKWSTELDVILGSNSSCDSACDFKIKENSDENSNYTIFLGDGTTVLAQVTQMNAHNLELHNLQIFNEDTFRMTVYPNVDYTFIVALGVILYELLRVQRRKVLKPVSKMFISFVSDN